MLKPIVAIVGRPNVGKSSLFNKMTGAQTAIIEDFPGVTRDRNYKDVQWEDKTFAVVDTGGFYQEPSDDIFGQIKEQALFAIDEADVIIHLLDGKDGLTASDMDLSRVIRASGKDVLWVVNKIDAPTREDRLYDFYRIGASDLWPVSAATGYGYDDFMDKLVSMLPAYAEEDVDYPKIAVVGRPNVGKSTLVNALLSKKRMIVSSLPGTTRDSVDSLCTYYGRKYLLIDTAGLNKKDRLGYSLDRFSMVRAVRSIDRCDVALIVIDAKAGIVDQDQRIAGIVEEYGKGAVFLFNKWDLVEEPEKVYGIYGKELLRKMWFLQYAPVLTVSALEKLRITKIFAVADEIIAERRKRISTASLNRALGDIIHEINLPPYKGKDIKISYITQVEAEPPAFAVFTNYPAAFKDAHIRHMEKVLRNAFSFKGTPIRIYIKAKSKTKPKK
ncbi:MAG TPA: ribosome biogenesis GTPase Der [Thermodesulfovibrionales bacterium]|nr:ribosome biogenesis GTPase Der [Thermodesulfovibrionales bacterium]